MLLFWAACDFIAVILASQSCVPSHYSSVLCISCVTRTTYIAMWEQYRGNKQAPHPAHAMAERPFAKVYVQLHRVIPQ